MEFRIDDILKNIIPGIFLFLGIIFTFFTNYSYEEFVKLISTDVKEYSEILLVAILIFSYLCGHIVDYLSSLLEYYLIYSLFGSPTMRLLIGKGDRIKLVDYEVILKKINNQCFPNNEKVFTQSHWHNVKTGIEIFKNANSVVNTISENGKNEKLKEFYISYIFARNLAFAFTFFLLILFFTTYQQIQGYQFVFLTLIAIILFLRRRDRSYYYSRLILNLFNKN